ncbi:AraC family transcriptional regulator [Burkholderia singularis]|uniref:AraC family transcriptional regulator n=1 Tax=Burkholderia singularis TaxID=1503053 RepID=A0A103E5D5_9BURK|nr:AraC family transcriptional regulator [Burkholderia singularis]KVE28679.1 AraC family transcriptional regulator [Burkholderia singularis]
MKPQYERVTIPAGCSIRVYHRRLAAIPFEWHHHPEYELTLTLNSRGRRFIGDHAADYDGDDLALVPPNLPHTWASEERIDPDAPQVALVVWFTGDWARRVADCCPEFGKLHSLLRRAAPGLAFGQQAAAAMRARLPALLDASPRARLAAVLDALAELAETAAQPLATAAAYSAKAAGVAASKGQAQAARSATGQVWTEPAAAWPRLTDSGSDRVASHGTETESRETNPAQTLVTGSIPANSNCAQSSATPAGPVAASPIPEAERLDRVLDLLERRFHEPLRIAELAAAAHLSERSLQRRFAQHVGESIGRYLQRVRIAYASRQLTATDWPIAVIAARAGFSNLSNFNRQFRTVRNMTPREYRQWFAAHGRAADSPEEPAPLNVRSPSLERRSSRQTRR